MVVEVSLRHQLHDIGCGPGFVCESSEFVMAGGLISYALPIEAKMNGLQFTDEAARQLEKAYLTSDVIAQRSETIRHLNLSAGERVLGCLLVD